MLDRREFFGITLGAGATLALTPELLRALQQPGGKLNQRAAKPGWRKGIARLTAPMKPSVTQASGFAISRARSFSASSVRQISQVAPSSP